MGLAPERVAEQEVETSGEMEAGLLWVLAALGLLGDWALDLNTRMIHYKKLTPSVRCHYSGFKN